MKRGSNVFIMKELRVITLFMFLILFSLSFSSAAFNKALPLDSKTNYIPLAGEKKIISAEVNLSSQDLRLNSLTFNLVNSDSQIESQTRKFLRESINTFGIDESKLELRKVDKDPGLIKEQEGGIRYVSYVQEFEGVPVYYSGVDLLIVNNKINVVKYNYFSNVTVDVKENISKEKAINVVKDYLGIRNPNYQAEKIEKIILPIRIEKNNNYILAWKISLPYIKESGNSWVFFIDANTGEVVRYYDRITSISTEGIVSGEVFEYSPLNVKNRGNFFNQFVYASNISNPSFYSGAGNNLNNSMTTKGEISLAGKNNIQLKFSTSYELETNYDYIFIEISSDNGQTWDQLAFYNGYSNGWINQTIDLNLYAESNILIRFRYVTDSSVVFRGFSVDNISVLANSITLFSDDARNSSLWHLNGFLITGEIGSIVDSDVTNRSGYYSLSYLSNETILHSMLNGPYADVENLIKNDSKFEHNSPYPINVLNWDWITYDDSYRGEESNLFYHVNVVHDYFTKGDPFNISEMNYQSKAYVELLGECNAFADGTDIYFLGPGGFCDSTALGADIIYHEYTHNVVAHIYPYFLDSSVNEALADYFAASITNDQFIGEGVFPEAIRDLKNDNRWPGDISFDPHITALIFSGALWDLRFDLGQEYTDNLVISAMKANSQSFEDFLETMLVLDDNNGNLNDGTSNILSICHAFLDNHGLYSKYCIGHTLSPILRVTNLKDGAKLYGNVVSVRGMAVPSAGSFLINYKFEYFDGSQWNIINEGDSGFLDKEVFWDISQLSKGPYTLRLSAMTPEGDVFIDEISVYRDIPDVNGAALVCDSSPCIATSDLIRSRDNLFNTPEPNQPNTFTYCRDGEVGEYLVDESIENITVTNLNNHSQFLVGDEVKVDVWAYCWGAFSDYLRIKYTSDTATPDFLLESFQYCNSTGFERFSDTIILDNKVGYHAIRGTFSYLFGDLSEACEEGPYSDNDDVILLVRDIISPEVLLINPKANETISQGQIFLEFIPYDNVDLDYCNVRVYSGDNSQNLFYEMFIDNISNNLSIKVEVSGIEDSNYLWNVECTDTSNNSVISESREFKLDLEKIRVISPNSRYWNTRGVFFNISLDNTTNLFEYSDNGGRFKRLCTNCDKFVGVISLGYGDHSIALNASGVDYKIIHLSVDDKSPRILRTEPKRGFASGIFNVEFTEDNPTDLTLFYGNSIRNHSVDIGNECVLNRTRYKCQTEVNLSDFDGGKIKYWFELRDIVGNIDSSRETELEVDKTLPILNTFNYSIDRRRITLRLNVTETNFDKITYTDSNDKIPRPKVLCSRLSKDGICEVKKTFSLGPHNLNIKVLDEAGNFAEINETFVIV